MREFVQQYISVIHNLYFYIYYSVMLIGLSCTSSNILWSDYVKERHPEAIDEFDLRIFIRRFWGSILTISILGIFGIVEAILPVVNLFVILISAYMLREIEMALQFTGIDLKYLGLFERKINKIIREKIQNISIFSNSSK